jgi:hypothetical protein
VSLLKRVAPVLNPVFKIASAEVVMVTQQVAGVSVKTLGKKAGSLQGERGAVIAALDMLFVGY